MLHYIGWDLSGAGITSAEPSSASIGDANVLDSDGQFISVNIAGAELKPPR